MNFLANKSSTRNNDSRRRRRPFRQVNNFTTAAATVAFSLSVVAAFQSSLPVGFTHRAANNPTHMHVLKDPRSLPMEALAYQDDNTNSDSNNNNNSNKEIEKLYSISLDDDRYYPHAVQERAGTAKVAHPVQFKGLTSTARKRKAVPKSTKSANTRNRSSTMPGFSADSNNQKAHRDGVRLVERRTGRKVVDTPQDKQKRKKANGEAMYLSSTSVPDSMIQFAGEIHREERITRQEEIELGEKTQEAVRLQNHFEALKVQLNREPTDEEWCAASGKINMEALRMAIEEGLEAKNKLVTSNLRMVQSVVNTYIRNGLSGQYNAGDLMQEGIVALIRAAEKFEPDRGWKFSTYAMYWVRSSVKRNQVYQSRKITVPQRLHESYKRLLKVEADLKVELKRQPTRKELGQVIGMSEMQVDRCISAMEQRCYSLDQEVSNGHKPMSSNGSGDTLLDILDYKADDGEHRILEQNMLRADLIETLHRHLSPQEVELLLLRYGLKEIPGQSANRQITIAELSRLVGIKPDKVRRTIKKSLEQLKAAGTDEWQSFQRQLN